MRKRGLPRQATNTVISVEIVYQRMYRGKLYVTPTTQVATDIHLLSLLTPSVTALHITFLI